MKSIFIILFNTLSFLVFAQPAKISGKLINADKLGMAHLTNIAQQDVPIKVNKDGSFAATINNLKAGVYQLTEVGNVYLEPSFDLIIKPNKDSIYIFTGKGSVENNLNT